VAEAPPSQAIATPVAPATGDHVVFDDAIGARHESEAAFSRAFKKAVG
jgi:hypothetical protein